MAQIHATALVDPRAELGRDVVVGPWCLVEADSVIGDGCRLEARAIVKARTTLGCNNEIGEGAVLGAAAQHVQVHDPGGTLTIGSHNRIRENVTIHRGWNNDGATILGDHNMLMVGSHVAHDCRVGSHCILVNHVLLGGHVQLDDRAYLGGASAVHQFCRIGRLAMIAGLAKITQDVPPFVMVEGSTSSQVIGLNKVGIRRNGYTPEQIVQLKEAYRVIYREGRRWSDVLAMLKADYSTGPAAAFHEFFKTGKRGFVQERRISRRATLKIADPGQDESEQNEGRRREAA
ncbi:MAG TPA: acyl-ACP--UDP-N-acetylglucosamine O-acyltransferase [Pirellulaceae bacterium]|nr:acyl-ACP--UDP-N-acetylglucosamine O-acyltransferase [Pirellulaceae bacterium]